MLDWELSTLIWRMNVQQLLWEFFSLSQRIYFSIPATWNCSQMGEIIQFRNRPKFWKIQGRLIWKEFCFIYIFRLRAHTDSYLTLADRRTDGHSNQSRSLETDCCRRRRRRSVRLDWACRLTGWWQPSASAAHSTPHCHRLPSQFTWGSEASSSVSFSWLRRFHRRI